MRSGQVRKKRRSKKWTLPRDTHSKFGKESLLFLCGGRVSHGLLEGVRSALAFSGLFFIFLAPASRTRKKNIDPDMRKQAEGSNRVPKSTKHHRTHMDIRGTQGTVYSPTKLSGSSHIRIAVPAISSKRADKSRSNSAAERPKVSLVFYR